MIDDIKLGRRKGNRIIIIPEKWLDEMQRHKQHQYVLSSADRAGFVLRHIYTPRLCRENETTCH